MENSKMMKTAAVIDRILKILKETAIVCSVICLVFAVLTLLFGEKIVAHVDIVSIGPLRLTLKNGSSLLKESALKTGLTLSLVFAAISLAICVYGIRLIRKVLEPMKEGRPFDKGISETIKKLAWVALIGGAIIQVCGSITKIAEIKAYDFSAFFAETVVTGLSFNGMIDCSFVVTACVLFLLSYVFRYGEELQQESDETL
ncbi:MAG: DUF2975 domain-containing protein [Lachnospiraceae bacterium]|nr:DUF2975 domain-containing protein [Lachnospiraceae bacterium]